MTKRLIKKIDILIDCCSECPYCNYDSRYNISYDSGYDCRHSEAPLNCRIVDDWEVSNSANKNPKGWPEIPEWCPLEDENIPE